MKTIDNIKKWADKFENKTAKIIAFYGAVTGFVALFPTIIAIIVWMYFFFVDLFNISNYVKEFRQATEYNHFMIMQLTHMVEAEADPKESFGIPAGTGCSGTASSSDRSRWAAMLGCRVSLATSDGPRSVERR